MKNYCDHQNPADAKSRCAVSVISFEGEAQGVRV